MDKYLFGCLSRPNVVCCESSAVSRLLLLLNVSVANSADPDQTAPLGAVWSGSTLFAWMPKLFNDVSIYMKQAISADDIFSRSRQRNIL